MSESERPMLAFEKGYLALTGIFLVSLVVANIITAKLFVLAGVTLAAGIIPYPITFLATDLISEVYGRKRANAVVLVGFFLSLYVLVLLKLGQWAEPYEGLNRQAEYEVIFGGSMRAIVASMIAYLAAQLIDVRLFHYWKQRTEGKHLWLRNNASTMVSQIIDTVLVVSILFWGVLEPGEIVSIIIAGYIFKLIIAAVDTPFFYFGVKHLGAWADPERESPPIAGDLGILAACFGAIALIVHGAYAWGTVGGTSQLVAGGAAIVVCTMALARPVESGHKPL